MFLTRFERWLDFLYHRKKNIKNYNDLFNLEYCVEFWRENLLERCQRLFVWENLPFPQREIENLLMFRGKCAFVKHKRFLVSEYAVTPCTYSGVTEYMDIGRKVTWTTPLVSGTFKMQSEDGVLIRNNSLTNGIMSLIERYSIMLANVDMSLVSALVNERCQNVLLAESQNVADSINSFYKTIEEDGKRKAIVNPKLFEAIQGAVSLPTVSNKETIKPILECYDTLLQMFYNDIGIRYNKDKKERMISNEVESDSQRLLINIKDMLDCREKACEEINKYFGLNVSVKMSNEIVLSENKQENSTVVKNDSSQLEEPQTAEEQKENIDYSF